MAGAATRTRAGRCGGLCRGRAGSVGAAATIAGACAGASRTIAAISRASGRFLQNFPGMCWRMARGRSRAGLKTAR